MYTSKSNSEQKSKHHNGSKSFIEKKGNEDLFIQKKEHPNLAPVQAKFIVGKSNDQYEQQADNAAQNVMQSKKANTTSITSFPNNHIQTKSNSQGNTAVSSSFATNLTNSKGKGSSLSQDTNTAMSSAFNTNFNTVKVHTDNSSINMNNQLKSRAFTNGNNIYFNRGEYAPNSSKGKRLLAHELTHVIQQKGSNEATIQKQEDEDIPVSQHVIDLAPLSRVPRLAHQRWERLSSQDRTIVFYGMIDRYGVEFTRRFWELANAGIHNYGDSYLNRTAQRRDIRFRDEVLLQQGFINAGITQDADAFGRVMSRQFEVWLHPDGRMIYVVISNPSNVDTSPRQRLVPEPPDVSLPEPEMNVPEADAPTTGSGDQLELDDEFRPEPQPNTGRRRHTPRLGNDTLTPPNFRDLELNL